jgi:magnesium chelatase family protein
VLSAKKKGRTTFFIPQDNLFELEYIPDITIYPIAHFSQLVDYFSLGKPLNVLSSHKDIYQLQQQPSFDNDFMHIKGQLLAKRALAIAAAGFHNALMVGAPGSGKTMLSKAMQSILPPLDFSEMLEVSQIYSVVGKLNKDLPLITQRPFRQVHHTASRFSIIGGGTSLTP